MCQNFALLGCVGITQDTKGAWQRRHLRAFGMNHFGFVSDGRHLDDAALQEFAGHIVGTLEFLARRDGAERAVYISERYEFHGWKKRGGL